MQWWKSEWVIVPAVFLAVFGLMVGMFYVTGKYHVPPPAPAQKEEKVAEVSVLHADRTQGTTVIVEVHGVRGLGLLVNRKKNLFCWTASYIVREIGFGGQTVFRFAAADDTEISLRGVVILYEEEEGVALLRFAVPHEKGVDFPSVTFLDALKKPKEEGRVLHTTMLPDGTLTTTHGIVASVGYLYAGMSYDIVTCNTVLGSGGGGVFDIENSCLGIVSMGMPGRTLIIPARRIHALAERKGIPWASDLSVPMP